MKKRLVNPTDDDLNSAFAEYVALIRPMCHCGEYMDAHGQDCGHTPTYMHDYELDFVRSVASVLPYLERWTWRADGDNFPSYYVRIWEPGTMIDVHDEIAFGESGTLACAIVIALLRAHGFEITFTPNGDEAA